MTLNLLAVTLVPNAFSVFKYTLFKSNKISVIKMPSLLHCIVAYMYFLRPKLRNLTYETKKNQCDKSSMARFTTTIITKDKKADVEYVIRVFPN